MGLAEIVQRISAGAEKESAEIVAAAREDAAGILARAKDDASGRREKSLAEARAKADRDRGHALARARLDANNQILAEKRKALDSVAATALEILDGLDPARYRAMFATAVARRAIGDEKIAVAPAEAKRLGATFVSEVNAALAKAGKPGGLAAAAEGDETDVTGVVLIGDGSRESITAAGLVAEARLEAEPALAKILFDKGGPA